MISVQSAVKYSDDAVFQTSLNDSLEWLMLGESCHRVAMLVLENFAATSRAGRPGITEIYLFGHYFRNAAQALEAWTKGILSCRRPLDNADLKHDLTGLFAECGLVCSSSSLLGRLRHYLYWAGRYPTPRSRANATTDHVCLCMYEDVVTVCKLMTEVRAKLIEERKAKNLHGKGFFYAIPNHDEVSKWEACLKEYSQTWIELLRGHGAHQEKSEDFSMSEQDHTHKAAEQSTVDPNALAAESAAPRKTEARRPKDDEVPAAPPPVEPVLPPEVWTPTDSKGESGR